MNQVIDFFKRLFDTSCWPPRWHCGYWTDFHGWLYILSDLAIWAAYFAIPTALFFILKKKKDIPLPGIFWLFMAFIMLCGITHLIDAIIFWWPAYRLSAFVRFITAVVSLVTVVSLLKVIPEVLKLKTSTEYELELEERIKVEAELKIAKEQAERSEKAKEQFLANMSHEIRTPMNAVVGFAQLLGESKLTSLQRDYVEVIQKAGNNLLVVINDILDLSKIESGSLDFERKPMDINEQMNSLKVLFEPKAAEKNLKLLLTVDEEIPPLVLGDKGRLTQILINLVSNAIKFTENGEVKVACKVVNTANGTITVMFSVADTGIGIPKDKHDDVFKRFAQTHVHDASKFGGSGLGLTIVKHLIDLLQGSMTLESEEGKGATFSFTLPFEKVDANTQLISETEEPKKARQENLNRLSVLVVEDNEVNRRLMQIVLSSWGINADFAVNGLEAITTLREKKYDLIFMDIEMPIMGGFQATKHIREDLNLTTPIIALTAHAMSHEVASCMASGMDDFIAKPFNKDDFYNKIVKFAKP